MILIWGMSNNMSNEDDLIVVYAGNSIDTYFLKSLLEDAGVTTLLKDEMMGNIAPWIVEPGGIGAVKIIVKEKDIDRAKPIVHKFINNKPSNIY